MSSSGDVWGIVLAAGRGDRFGGPKHHLTLDGEPLWTHGRRALEAAGLSKIIVVGDVPGGIEGGPRRQDSTANGLDAVPEGVEFVIVHDAARPLASPELVRRVLHRLLVGDAAAVIPVLPVTDTVKEVAGDEVIATVDRSALRAVQTPQGFSAPVLRRALRSDAADVTDDSALIERLGERVVTVPGETANIKVTYPEDLHLAALLRSASHD